MGRMGDFQDLLSSHLAFLCLCAILFCECYFIYNEVSLSLIGSWGQFATYQLQYKGTVMNGLGKHGERKAPISLMGSVCWQSCHFGLVLLVFPLLWAGLVRGVSSGSASTHHRCQHGPSRAGQWYRSHGVPSAPSSHPSSPFLLPRTPNWFSSTGIHGAPP